jgi:hypothetical protein
MQNKVLPALLRHRTIFSASFFCINEPFIHLFLRKGDSLLKNKRIRFSTLIDSIEIITIINL